ncbi:MAG: hypothetical protein II304_03555 [Bacteroidales bacterium]|nr:hypothetical protein [Bacteroidales bacterium]
MIGEDFIFDNQMLSEYGMKMYDPNTSQEWIGREIERAEISSTRPIPNHYTVRYLDTLTLNFLIIRNDREISNKKELELDRYDINRLRTWLESPKRPISLEVLNNSAREVVYFGIFTNIQPFLVAEQCYGLYLTFKCNAPYGFSLPYKKVFNINGSTESINNNIHIHSAELKEYIKPIIKIYSSDVFIEGETIEITNPNDNSNKMILSLPANKQAIIIDCEKKIVEDNFGNNIPIGCLIKNNDISSNSYDYLSMINLPIYWLQFVPHDNRISILGNENNTILKVEIIYREIIKAGGF